MKILLSNDNARQQAVAALEKVALAVGTTLGPGGLPAIIETRSPAGDSFTATTTKDGVTVLRGLKFTDPVEHAIHHFACLASMQTMIDAADGTTSTALIASAVARELISHKNMTPQAFARKILAESEKAIAAIRAEAQVGEDVVERAVMTACNGDAQVTSIVMEALKGVSSFGSIHIEKNPLEKEPYQVRVQAGYHAGRGYNWHDRAAISVSNAAAARDVVVMEKPRVFLYNGYIQDPAQIEKVLEKLVEATDGSFNLLIVAHDVDERVGEALWKFNTKRRTAKVFIVKSPVLGEERSGFHHMLDVASITASTVYDYGSMDEFVVAGLGICDKVEINEHKTVIHGRAPNHTVPERARQNEDAAKRARSQQDVDMIHTRNAELTEGLMTIVLGGAHAAILQERKDRVEDAVGAAQSARTSGVLPGCGVSYIRAADLVQSETLARAFRIVHRQILANFGFEDHGRVLSQGVTIGFKDGEMIEGSFLDLNVTDSADTVTSVIKNGVQLGVLCATVGCISLTSNLVEIEGERRLQDILQGATR